MAREKAREKSSTTSDSGSRSSSSGIDKDKEEQKGKGSGRGCCSYSRGRGRGPGPTVILAALVSLLVSSAAGVALTGVLMARQRDRLAAPDESFDPAFYLARDLILFASAMAILYVALHVRAARRRVYCCARSTGASAGSDGGSSGDGDAARDSCSGGSEGGSAPDGHNDSNSSGGGGGGGGSSGYHMRTTMRKSRLPPHLRGNYLHASALLVARLAIIVWIAALIATAVMIARAGPIPFRYADGSKKGFVGAVPVLNLLICIGAIPPFVIISATIEKQHTPFATRGLTKASFLTCRVSNFGDDLEHGADDDDDKLLMMSVSRRTSVEQQRTRQQQQQQIPSTANDDAITMSSLEIFQQGARLVAGLGSRLIGKTEPPVPEEPAKPPSPPQPAYNPGGWREEWNNAAEQLLPSSKPAQAPAKEPGSGSATRYTHTCTQTTQAVATRTEKVSPRAIASPPTTSSPSSTNPPSVASASHYTSSQYSADSSASSKPSEAPVPPQHCYPQPCHCKDPPVPPPNGSPSINMTSNQPQVHSTPIMGPRPVPAPMLRPRPRPRAELGPRPGPGPRGPAAPSTSIASSGRRTGLSTVRYAERPEIAVQQPLRVFVPPSSVATSFASSSVSSATTSSIGPVSYPGRHYDAGAPRTAQHAAPGPVIAQLQNQNQPPARSEPAPAPRYYPATVEVYNGDDDPEVLGTGGGGWTAPDPIPPSGPVPVSHPNPDPYSPSPNTAVDAAVSVLRNAQRAQKAQGAQQQRTGAELAIGTGLGLGIVEKEQSKGGGVTGNRDEVRAVATAKKDVEVRIPGAFGAELE